MQITQCLHVAILVTDLNRAEHFYGEILKLPKTERSRNFPGSWYQVGEYQLHLIVISLLSSPAKNEKWAATPTLLFQFPT